MTDSLAGVVLAAGAGRRLLPLSRVRPKALCPVANVPLVDHAVGRVGPLVDGLGAVAVNLHHGSAQVDAHLAPELHRSFEHPEALGTAGALGALRPWLDGRDVVVTNADAWFPPGLDLSAFLAGWDRERIRLLGVREPARGDFGDLRYCGVALMPACHIRNLRAEPSGLYEVSWRHEWAANRLDVVVHEGAFIDCGSPAEYLAANMAASGGRSVIAPGAVVESGAELDRCVLWEDAVVRGSEDLTSTVRGEGLTLLIR